MTAPESGRESLFCCQRCGSDEHGGDVGYDGCADCREPEEPTPDDPNNVMGETRWKDRKHFNERRKAAREALSLALDSLATSGGADDANEAADALAAADAHAAAARDEIEAAFRGIDS